LRQTARTEGVAGFVRTGGRTGKFFSAADSGLMGVCAMSMGVIAQISTSPNSRLAMTMEKRIEKHPYDALTDFMSFLLGAD
jgi:hypothetical protein